jgi:hypothetical protein
MWSIQIAAGGLQRWNKSDQKSGCDGRKSGEEEDTHIQGSIQLHA